jgi:hypothetical protein
MSICGLKYIYNNLFIFTMNLDGDVLEMNELSKYMIEDLKNEIMII